MAFKKYDLPNVGSVRVFKRQGATNIRLSIASDGTIRVSIPAWASFVSGLQFAEKRLDWIQLNLPQKHANLEAGMRIGKAHRLVFATAAIDSPSTRIKGTEIVITRPAGMAVSHPAVQTVAEKAAIRALRTQASILLPKRLHALAQQYGFTYSDVSIRQLKGRWGSCDSQQHIVLNLYLMQLPWELIDYVLLHELVHTQHMNHGPEFWNTFLSHQPAAKQLRKQIKLHQPQLQPTPTPSAVA